MNHRTSSLSRRNLRAYVAAIITYVMLAGQVAPLVAAAAPHKAPAAAPAPAPTTPLKAAPMPAPMPVFAPSITATKVDSFPDPNGNGKAEPGDTVTYTVTITNTGPDPATGVTFTDSVDANTGLVAGSITTTPIASPDTATAFGNVRISTDNGAPNLLTNDCDPDPAGGPCTNAGLTASGPTTSTNGGNVTVASDGKFTYNPAPGYTGTDDFTYTVTDGTGKTDTAKMTITVGPTLIWFINNTAAASGDGRITTPFNSIAAFNATAADDPGDIIFIYNGTGTYTGGITLLNTQKLIGQGFALATETGAAPAGSDALPAATSSPTIDNVGANIITLGQNNTLRGFNTGNSGAAGTDITGTSFGTLTVSNLSLNGDGRALNLTTGTLAATVGGITVSNTGANAGVVLNGVGGSLAVSGTTGITNPGGNGIDIQNAPAGASYGFGTATISKNAAGAGINLATNNAGATTSFTSLTVSNSSGAGITTNNGGTLNATTGSITTTGTGVAASFTNTALGLTFTSVSSNGGANGLVFSGGTGSFTSGTTNLQNNAGIGLLMSSSAVAASFGNTTVNSSAGDAVDLSSNTANITFADLDMTPDAGLRGLDAQNNTGTITATSGDITTSGAATASAVFIDGPAGRTPINLTFTSVTTSGVGNSINLVDTSGTKFEVTGTTQVNTRATTNGGGAVFVDNATTTTIQLGTTNIPNPNAAGGQGIHVEDSSSAVTVSSATISDPNQTSGQTDPGSDGFPDTDGDGDAVFLRGNTGLFTLSGGTLSNCGNDCIDARTSRIAISGVTITNPGQDVGGGNQGLGGHGIAATNLTGASTISGVTISGFNGANRFGLAQRSNTGTMTLTLTTTTFQNATGAAAITAATFSTANLTLTVGQPGQGCTFTNILAGAIISSADDTSTNTTTVQNSTFQNAPTNGKMNVTGGISASGGTGTFNIINNTFTNVFKTASTGEALISFSGNATTTNSFATNISGNTITGVGVNNTSCGGGATFCAGPLEAILVFTDAATHTNGTININNNIISNVMQGGILLDLANSSGGNTDAKITGNTVGTDAAPVGAGPSASVTNQFGIHVSRRRVGAQTANVLVSNNSIRNGNGTPTTLNPGIFVRGQANTNLSTTITGNNVNTLSTGPVEIRVDANTVAVGDPDAAIVCADITGNTVAGGAGSIDLNEGAGNTLNIEQASAAAVATANGIPAGNVTADAGVSFGVTCAVPPAAPVGDTSDFVQEAPLGAPSKVPADEAGSGSAFDGGVTSRPFVSPRSTAAPQTAAPKAVKAEAKRSAGTTYRYAAADTSAPLNTAPETAPEPVAQRRKVVAPVLSDAPPVPNGPGGTVSIQIGTLAPNDSVTITFQVVVDNPYGGGPNISNQGTVSGSNFSNVLTDDPDVAGANNPTLTPINAIDIRINDAKVPEPQSPGTVDMAFTVSLSQPAGGAVTINFATADGTATAGTCGNPGADYVSTSGQVSFAAGQQVKTINVPVCSDAAAEGDETFVVNLSGASSGTLVDSQATGTITANTPGTFLISELRTSGPGGAGDDFVEFYNNTNSPLTVAASDASAGYGLYKMGAACTDTPVLIGTIPNGTVIPARGHYLMVGSQYTLANYGGTGAAAGNLTLTSDIEDDRNVAVFTTSNIVNISSLNRLDAVGFGLNTGVVCDLLREPSNLPPLSGSTTEYSYFRQMGSATGGNPKDINDNNSDFTFADTMGTNIAGVPRRLGAPGPENLASPIRRDNSGVGLLPLDQTQSSSAEPNRSRDSTPGNANFATFGTLTVRRRVVNNTGGNVTRLRFRIVEMTTLPQPPGTADLRALTGAVEPSVGPVGDAGTCGASPVPCTVTVQATTLETPPAQPIGGGLNSSLAAGTITLGTPLAPGASLNVNFRLGVQQPGTFRFLIIVEALP